MLLEPDVLQEYQSEFRRALESEQLDEIAPLAEHLSSARLAVLLMEVPRSVAIATMEKLPPARAGRIMGNFPPEFAVQVMEEMPVEQAAALLQNTPLDQAADILDVMNAEDTELLLAPMSADFKKQLRALQRFPQGTAGSVMEPKFLSSKSETTIGGLRQALLDAPREFERVFFIYVVDNEGKLKGTVSIQNIFRLAKEKTLGEVMDTEVTAVRIGDSSAEAARVLQNRRLTMLPVVDEQDILVGVITLEDAIDILAHDVADQFAKLGAVAVDESFFTPPKTAVRGRLPWMIANVFLNLGAVFVITSFETTIEQVAILAAFLPMITDMGGNVGIQSLSVSIRSIALDEVRLRDFWKGVRKEVIIGLVNGLALGALFATIAWVMQGSITLGVLAGLALGCNVLVAGVVGGTLPFIIKRFGKDPAMMTGPVLTTITDITGVTIYLGLATLFLADLLAAGV